MDIEIKNETIEVHNNRKGNIFQIIIAIIILLVFQQLASKAGVMAANIFSYTKLDPDNTFAWISVHHIVQMVIALAAIAILKLLKGWKFGFVIGKAKTGFKYVVLFSTGVLIFAIILYAIGMSLDIITLSQYPLNTRNILGTLGFQLLLSGTSEEILFRALPVIVITHFTKSGLHLGRFRISAAILTAAVLFTIAHIQWSFKPLSINADIMQLVQSLIFGIAYGKAFEKSGSILYPAIMHSISNVIMVGMGYFIYII